jgi:hypothetical protein
MITLAAAMLVFTGCANNKEEAENDKAPKEQVETDTKQEFSDPQDVTQPKDFIIKAAPQKIEHVHGIGYPGNDDGLYVASHHGIKIFKEGQWLEAASENHDYMGFQAVEDGFYASGHPEEGSDLKNPLGLIKSTDKGETLEKVAFYGESDFHFLSASFQDQVLYLINEEANSKLDRGVYVSKDAAKSWEQVELNGLKADSLGIIAAHPENGGTFAMSTREGVFVTDDFGKNMNRLGEYEMVTAAAYSKESLYISPVENNKIKLVKLNNAQPEKAEELTIPTLKYDNPITYIAADPKKEGRIAFITILNDLYESLDGGQTWKQVLVNGRIK